MRSAGLNYLARAATKGSSARHLAHDSLILASTRQLGIVLHRHSSPMIIAFWPESTPRGLHEIALVIRAALVFAFFESDSWCNVACKPCLRLIDVQLVLESV